MSIQPGTRFGAYEVVSPLGAGGMGEVYRARDTKLGREVAIKVVSAGAALDPERAARFEREAHLLASLNHPHIATVHGLEQAGATQFLVMELVEGETLADVIARGPLPVAEALRIARQIAEALQAAHDKGIVHRDLKPANVALSANGQVKVLDFGLAKAVGPAEAVVGPAEAGRYGGPGADVRAGLSISPTLSLAATQAGVILGTAAYMSPEQARGRAVDKRCDLWAFGCVLYEMLTGRRAFPGADLTDVIAAVVRGEADWTLLPPGLPVSIRLLLKGCLARERDERVGDAAVIRFAIDQAVAAPDPVAAPAALPPSPRTRTLAIGGVILAAAVGAAAAWMARAAAPAEPIAFQVNTGATPRADSFALSPDGRYLVFVGNGNGVSKLFVRAMSSSAVRVLDGTDNAMLPFWSPDSRGIGFFAASELKRIDVAGSAAETISRTPPANALGGTWNEENVILFSRNGTGILRVDAAGGEPRRVTEIGADETNHALPVFLPGGRHFLYLRAAGTNSRLMWRSLDGSEERVVRPLGSKALYAAPGLLLFKIGVPLFAQPFDAATGAVAGDAVQVAARVWAQGVNAAFSYSPAGLAYRASTADAAVAQLTWFDRTGGRVATVAPPADYRNAVLNGAADSVAVNTVDPNDLWLVDGRRSTRTRLTFDGTNSDPVFSPDGRVVAFYSSRNPPGIYRKTSSGSGREEPLAATGLASYPRDWSSDGRFLLYDSGPTGTMWVLPLAGDRKPTRFPPSPPAGASIGQGRFSPDVKWIAYTSDETGRQEVFVEDYPSTGAKYQVSVDGGSEPRWRGDAGELYFIAPDGRLMAVEVSLRPEFRLATPRPLFATHTMSLLPPSRRYGVSPDGRRFLLNAPLGEDAILPIEVILNWTAARRAP